MFDTSILLSAMLGVLVGGGGALGALVLYRRFHRRRGTLGRYQDIIPCYLSVQDRDLRILETNELFVRDFGARVGEHCYRAYKGRDTPCRGCPVLETIEDGRVHSGEEVVITSDGQVGHVVVTSAPVRDGRGRIIGAVEMSTNVTELHALRHDLARSRRDFKRLFDIVPCYITVQDRDFRIVESNETYRHDFGDSRGRLCYEKYKGRRTPCPECPVVKSFEDGKVHCSEERVVTLDGREAAVIVYSVPVRDENGEIVSVMEVSTNITEVKNLQRQLVMMGLAVAGMAHRTKNILMGLEGGIFVVNEGLEADDPSEVEEGWRMVERNVRKISRVVRDLLQASKEREPHFEEGVKPAEILREVYELYRDRMAAVDVALELDISNGDHAGTYDAEGIHSAVTNLAANALDACRFDPAGEGKHHRIVLRCICDQPRGIAIEVADNGGGIPEDLTGKVFQSFFSTKGTEGTGLGLLVVQKTVEEAGGTITFTSVEGEGTTFRIELPDRSVEALDQPA